MRHLEFEHAPNRELVFDDGKTIRSLDELSALLADGRYHSALVQRFLDGRLARWLRAIGQPAKVLAVERALQQAHSTGTPLWSTVHKALFSAEIAAKANQHPDGGEERAVRGHSVHESETQKPTNAPPHKPATPAAARSAGSFAPPKPPPPPRTVVEPSVLGVSGGVTIETIAELRTFAVGSVRNAKEIVSIAASGQLSQWLRAIGEPALAKAVQALDIPGTEPIGELAVILSQLDAPPPPRPSRADFVPQPIILDVPHRAYFEAGKLNLMKWAAIPVWGAALWFGVSLADRAPWTAVYGGDWMMSTLDNGKSVAVRYAPLTAADRLWYRGSGLRVEELITQDRNSNFRVGDILTSLGQTPISNIEELRRVLSGMNGRGSVVSHFERRPGRR